VTRLIIFLLFGILLLGTGAKAEIIYLNCKFESGNVDGKYRMNRGEPLTEDINVILDTGKKKLLKLLHVLKMNRITKKLIYLVMK